MASALDEGNAKSLKRVPRYNLIQDLKSLIIQRELDWDSVLEREVPRRWEKHGDLIILPMSAYQSSIWLQIEPELWDMVCKHLGCTRIARKSVVSDDDFRSPQVQLIYGHDGWVQRSDNGIKYSYDVTKCMFSAGNITEKLRIATWDCSGQVVVDLYAGIGYFTLPYLVHAKADHVFACEWNPHAVEALGRNLELNKVQDRCTVLPGDNQLTCPKGVADRVNLGLIPSSEPGWRTACAALKPKSGGMLHIHMNITSGMTHTNESPTTTPPIEDLSETLTEKQKRLLKFQKKAKHKAEWDAWVQETCVTIQRMLEDEHGGRWTVHEQHLEHVKSYAPHVDHVVLDLKCCPVGDT